MPFLRVVITAAIATGIALATPWVSQSSGTTAELRGLSVVDANTVWASGQRGTVIRTVNGGATWRVDTIPGAQSLDLRDIHAVSATTAYAISAGEAEKGLAKIFKTSDGGTSWRMVFTTDQQGVFFDAISFWDENHGIVMSDPVDGTLYLLRTDDGGSSWRRIPPASLPPVLAGEAAFAASGTCVAIEGKTNVWIATGGSDTARVFRSTDRGDTWSVSSTPVHSGGGAAGIFSVAFSDALHGVVVGGDYRMAKQRFDNVALTDDGGKTWRLPKGAMPAGFMSAVTHVPGTAGAQLVALGLGGTAISTNRGESWTMVDSIPYNAVAFAGARDAGWAAGPRGRVAKWMGAVGDGR